jgi:hypothetical protein
MSGRASLAYLGQEDIALSGDPEVTYFIERYAGQTLFTQRVDRVDFDEEGVSFGSQNLKLIPRLGDLITNMYLFIEFPVIPSTIGVLDSVGTLMFDYVELYIGSELVERLYGEYIEATLDFGVPKGKQTALSFLIGKTGNFLNVPRSTYQVPIPFSSFKRGLAMCCINEPIYFRIVWNPSTVFAFGPGNAPYQIDGNFNANLRIEYTYLADAEIKFMKSKRVQLIEQVQLNQFFIPNGVQTAQCDLNLYNPVKEFFFILQNDSALGYDYSNTATNTSTNIGSGDLLSQLELDFNTTERISRNVGSPQFLRIIQPLEFHTRIPDRIFYMYSFSLDPENDQPSGSVNLSRIKNQNLFLTLNQTPANVNVRVYAVAYNFIEGGKTVFSNFF